MKPSVLAIFPYTPNPVRIRAYLAARSFAESFSLDVIYLQDTVEPAELSSSVRRVWTIPNNSKAARAFRLGAGLLRGFPMNHEFYNSPKLAALLQTIPLEEYRAIYVERLPIHRMGLVHPLVIYDSGDCFSDLSRRLSAAISGPRRLLYKVDSWLLPEEERRACSAATRVFVTAAREREKLRGLGVKVPIAVWTLDFSTAPARRKLKKRSRFVVSFHGKLSYVANLIALRDINEKIAPFLPKEHVELRILGRSSPGIEKRFRKLTFSGFVPSIQEAVRDSDVSIMPMQVSVGFPTKAMESLACGVPIIATEEVVGGLSDWELLREKGIYVRPIEKFADQVLSMMALPLQTRETIAENCRSWAVSVYERSEEEVSLEALCAGLERNEVV